MQKQSLLTNANKSIRPSNIQAEEGMALLVAMLMGAVLLAGSSGLMIRQIMAQIGRSRKLSADGRVGCTEWPEPHHRRPEWQRPRQLHWIFTIPEQQRREKGWALPNTEGFELVELCTPVTKYTKAFPAGTQDQAPEVIINQGTIRADGVPDDIQISYRLRSYDTTAAAGNGEGTFYVEGFVKRGDTTLAQALLRRSLYVNSKVPGVGDWSVMSGRNLRLNNTEIVGPGNIFYLTSRTKSYSARQYASSCSDSALLNDVGSSNTDLAEKLKTIKSGQSISIQ